MAFATLDQAWSKQSDVLSSGYYPYREWLGRPNCNPDSKEDYDSGAGLCADPMGGAGLPGTPNATTCQPSPCSLDSSSCPAELSSCPCSSYASISKVFSPVQSAAPSQYEYYANAQPTYRQLYMSCQGSMPNTFSSAYPTPTGIVPSSMPAAVQGIPEGYTNEGYASRAREGYCGDCNVRAYNSMSTTWQPQKPYNL